VATDGPADERPDVLAVPWAFREPAVKVPLAEILEREVLF
jgi:hypothetical protein